MYVGIHPDIQYIKFNNNGTSDDPRESDKSSGDYRPDQSPRESNRTDISIAVRSSRDSEAYDEDADTEHLKGLLLNELKILGDIDEAHPSKIVFEDMLAKESVVLGNASSGSTSTCYGKVLTVIRRNLLFIKNSRICRILILLVLEKLSIF